jgi:putative ABC transport system permease protein
MSRVGWTSLFRQLPRAEAGWRPLVVAVSLGYALTVMAFAVGHRIVQHMSEMAAIPPEARLQITVSTHDGEGHRHEPAADLARIRAIAGVQAASWFEAPLRSTWYRPEIFTSAGWGIVGWIIVADDAADETLALHLVAGRPLQAEDLNRGPVVPILASRSFLAELGDGAWVGTHVRSQERGVEAEVVGVVEDFMSHGHMATSRNTVVWPSSPTPTPQSLYLVRVAEKDVPSVRQEIAQALQSPGRLVLVETVAEVLGQTLNWADRTQNMLHIFAAAIVLTVLLGTVAVCSFRVAERRRQHGILRALGARRADVAFLVVAESALAALAGVVIGLVLVYLLHGFLVGLIPFLTLSPRVLVACALMYLCVSALAALVPALSAARVSPSVASRGG